MIKTHLLWSALALAVAPMYAQTTQPIALDSIVVGSKTKLSKEQNATVVQVITQEDLKPYVGKSLSDVLQNLTGLNIPGANSADSQNKSIQFRGANVNDILILVDGFPVRNVGGIEGGFYDLRNIETHNIHQIEVQKGGASVLYGTSSAMVISITTKQENNKKTSGSISISGGSWGTFKQNAQASGLYNHWIYQANVTKEESNGFSSAKPLNGETNFDADPFKKKTGQVALGYQYKTGLIKTILALEDIQYHYDAGAGIDVSPYLPDVTDYLGKNTGKRASLLWNQKYLAGRGDSKLMAQINNVNFEQSHILGSDNSTNLWERNDATQYNIELRENIKFGNNLEMTFGGQAEHQKNGYYGLSSYGVYSSFEKLKDDKANSFSIYNGFAQLRANYKWVNLSLGSRYINHTQFGAQWIYEINPFVLIKTNHWRYKFGGTFNTGYRMPNLYELYDGFSGNTLLKPQLSKDAQTYINIFDTKGLIDWTIAGYFRNVEQSILYSSNTYQYENETNVYNYRGIETSLKLRPKKWINLDINYAYADVDFDESVIIYRLPKHKLVGAIHYNPLKNTSIYANYQYTSSRLDNKYLVDPSKNLLKAYNLFGLGFSQTLAKQINAFGRIDNLLNADYTDVYGYNTKGRNFTLGITLSF